MWSIMAASVVDFPDPVVPVTRMIPRTSFARLVTAVGQTQLLGAADVERHHAAGDRDRSALAKRVHAETGKAPHRVREVDLAVPRELGQPLARGQHLAQHPLRVSRAERVGVFYWGQLAAQPDERARWDLQMKVGPALLDDSVQRAL